MLYTPRNTKISTYRRRINKSLLLLNLDAMEALQDTQVRCRDCATGWVSLTSQEDIPSASHRLCEACNKKKHSQRTERRAREAKSIGRPPKQASRKSNRGRKPKNDLRDRFGDSLHVTAQVGVTDGDELAAQPRVPHPATRPRGRPRGRAWGPPPTQRPNAGRRLEPPHDLSSSPDPLHLSSQRGRQSESPASPPQHFPDPPDA